MMVVFQKLKRKLEYPKTKKLSSLLHMAANGDLFSLSYAGTSHDDIDMFINEEDKDNLKFIAKCGDKKTPVMMTSAGEARRALIDQMHRAR